MVQLSAYLHQSASKYPTLHQVEVQFGGTWCTLVQIGVVFCNVVQVAATWRKLLQLGPVWCTLVQVDATWYSLVQLTAD